MKLTRDTRYRRSDYEHDHEPRHLWQAARLTSNQPVATALLWIFTNYLFAMFAAR
jgi:hypothetical protein